MGFADPLPGAAFVKGGRARQALTGTPRGEVGVPHPGRYQLSSGYVATPAPGVDLGGSPEPPFTPRPVGHRHSVWVGGEVKGVRSARWGSWPAIRGLSWALSPEGLLRPFPGQAGPSTLLARFLSPSFPCLSLSLSLATFILSTSMYVETPHLSLSSSSPCLSPCFVSDAVLSHLSLFLCISLVPASPLPPVPPPP